MNKVADIKAMIDYMTTLSSIHGQRISIFTIPPTDGEPRFTHASIGFGSKAINVSGRGEDYTLYWQAEDGTKRHGNLDDLLNRTFDTEEAENDND